MKCGDGIKICEKYINSRIDEGKFLIKKVPIAEMFFVYFVLCFRYFLFLNG